MATTTNPGDGRVTRRGYADTPFGQMHFAQAGAGAPLLLLGSTPRSHRLFRPMQLACGPAFRTIAIDLLGFGHSDPAPPGFDIENHARSVIALMDDLGIERAHIFGLHTGNKIAAEIAARSPQRVDRLVLAGQTHSILIDEAERNPAILAFASRHIGQYSPASDGSHLVREWAAAMATANEYAWSPGLRVNPVIHPRDVESAEARVLDHLMGRKGIASIYESILSYDLPAAMRRIRAPTLILELLTEAEAHFGPQAPALCAMMQDARSATLANADGLAVEQRAAEIVAAISGFLLGR